MGLRKKIQNASEAFRNLIFFLSCGLMTAANDDDDTKHDVVVQRVYASASFNTAQAVKTQPRRARCRSAMHGPALDKPRKRKVLRGSKRENIEDFNTAAENGRVNTPANEIADAGHMGAFGDIVTLEDIE